MFCATGFPACVSKRSSTSSVMMMALGRTCQHEVLLFGQKSEIFSFSFSTLSQHCLSQPYIHSPVPISLSPPSSDSDLSVVDLYFVKSLALTEFLTFFHSFTTKAPSPTIPLHQHQKSLFSSFSTIIWVFY